MSLTIEPLTKAHVGQVAAIHAQALSGDFLPGLGAGFLIELYTGLLELNLGFGFVVKEGENVRGFVLGCKDSSSLFKDLIRRRFVRVSWAMSQGLVRNPRLISNVLETVLYPSKERVEGAAAELVVIAMAEGWRARGLGAQLVQRLDQEFRAAQISTYKVTVHSDKVDSNRFYQKLGFVACGSFVLYKKRWNLYLRPLPLTTVP